jgi:hypothetical protein
VIDPNDKRLTFLPEEDILLRQGPCYAIHRYWWAVHPDRGLILFGPNKAPQANMNQNLSIDLQQRLYPWAVIKRFDLVLIPDGGR